MYKDELALNILRVQWLICHKTKKKQNKTKSYISNIYMYKDDLVLNILQWFICYKIQINYILYI